MKRSEALIAGHLRQKTELPPKPAPRLDAVEQKLRDRMRKEKRRAQAAQASRAGYYRAP